MHVDTESDVVREIPAEVVWVIVDHDVIVIPIPVIHIGQVERGDAEVVPAEPEAVRSTAT
jgi:hypothetical protein